MSRSVSDLTVVVFLRVLDVEDSSKVEIYKGGFSVFINLAHGHKIID